MEFEELSSTNEYCKGNDIRTDCIIRAHRQTSGRGRMGRKFVSEEGGLYLSYCYLPPDLKAEKLMPLTGLCAVAVHCAIEKATGLNADIKWTNDLLLYGKKICGILVETVLGEDGKVEKLIIGIGINTNQKSECFEGELENIASSIYALTGKETDETKLLKYLSMLIHGVYSMVCKGDFDRMEEYAEYYRAHCVTIGKEVRILRPELVSAGKDPRGAYAEDPSVFPKAIAVDIDDNFGLIVRHKDGKEEKITFGEISIK